jgi:hypothetical protein
LKKPKTKKSPKQRLNRDARGLVALTSNPVWKTFAAKPMEADRQLSVSVTLKIALYALSNGTGTNDHLSDIIVTAHTAIVLAERGFGEDLMKYFLKSLLAALQCRARAMNGEPLAFTPEEADDVSQLVDLHEQQFALTTKVELSAAIVEGYARISSGKSPLHKIKSSLANSSALAAAS